MEEIYKQKYIHYKKKYLKEKNKLLGGAKPQYFEGWALESAVARRYRERQDVDAVQKKERNT